jgi:hypothetical protein
MTITWNIANLDRRTSDGFVTTAHWTVSAQDGDFSASAYGSCGWSGEPTVAYADLTQADVLNWVWESVDKAETETNLAKQIDAQKNPVTSNGVPW